MSTFIGINNLGRHATATAAEVQDAIGRVFQSGWYILGKECEAFEQEFAEFCGVSHCLGLANGTDAIEMGLRALGVGPGSRVVTVANAGFYTATALAAIGAEPVFVDVDRDTKLMALDQLEAVLAAGGIDAVVITHLYGLLNDMDAILKLTKPAGIPVFEDCAQSHGARRGGRRAGSFGDAASFSFYPTKNLGAIGDGGALVTKSSDVADKVRRLRQYGWESKYKVVTPGARNSRLDEIQAAVLRAKLPHVDRWNAKRRDIASRYSTEIEHPRVGCPKTYGDDYVGHLYVVTCEDRGGLQAHLKAAGVGTDVHYPIPDHRQPIIAANSRDVRLPVTEELADKVLTLPCYPELSDDEVATIIAAVNSW
ncbi:DegT/DnrJ/EryC1/StrS family aminotransferase [Microvirga sp. P5_D2]